MTAVPLGTTVYRRRGSRTAEVALLNLIVEKDNTNQVDGLVRYQRPALTTFATVGVGSCRGIFRRLGVLGSKYFVVQGDSLYSVEANGTSTLLGLVGGAGLVSIDGSATKVIVVADGVAYSTDGATVTNITMPSGEPVSAVVYVNGYFILTVRDTQQFFWIAPGGTNPDAFDFASVENAPDNIVAPARLLDEVWFFGQQSTEVFHLTGDSDAPFQPIPGRLYERGCANRDSIAVLDNTLFWVGNDFIAYRADTTPIRISDHSMEERFRVASGDLAGWAFQVDGHSFYCIRTGTEGSFVFDVENQNWARWKSYGQETWRAHRGAQVEGGTVVAGDNATNVLWMLDLSKSNDNGDPIEREITGGVTVIGRPVSCANFSIRVAVGWAPITGTAVNPKISMRYSDDGGELWSSWIEMPLGLQGQYLTEVVWRQLGQINAPGRIFTIRMTDDAIFRVHYARMNDAA